MTAQQKQLLVSIIIPTYNREEFLRDCVRSALRQTHRPLEVIVVDDGSSDGTSDLLTELEKEAGELPGVKMRCLTTTNGGAPRARNVGLEHSRGEYIVFLDSDDVLLDERLDVDMKVFAEHPAADIVYSKAQCFTEDGVALEKYLGSPYSSENHDYFRLYWQTMCATYRASFFRTTGGWDDQLPMWQDYELCQRLLVEYRANVFFNDRVLSLHRYGHTYVRIGQAQSAISLARKRYPAVIKIARMIRKSHKHVWRGRMRSALRVLKCLAIFHANRDIAMVGIAMGDSKSLGNSFYLVARVLTLLPSAMFARYAETRVDAQHGALFS